MHDHNVKIGSLSTECCTHFGTHFGHTDPVTCMGCNLAGVHRVPNTACWVFTRLGIFCEGPRRFCGVLASHFYQFGDEPGPMEPSKPMKIDGRGVKNTKYKTNSTHWAFLIHLGFFWAIGLHHGHPAAVPAGYLWALGSLHSTKNHFLMELSSARCRWSLRWSLRWSFCGAS